MGLAVWGLVFIQFRPGKYFRDFYGTYEVHRTTQNGRSRLELTNSYTIHGGMDLQEPLRPTTYFGIHSGFWWAMYVARARHPNLRIGLIGLGAGTSALYSKKGDHLVVYEISSQVLEIAGPHPNSFPFLSSSEAEVEIVEGDARIRMQEELSKGGREFDILLVDAFSGGNIPWHLLTAESLRLYQRHLKEDGLLVMHVSNRLPLDRVVAATAKEVSMNSIGIYHPSKENPSPLGIGDEFSRYVVLSGKLDSLLDGYMMGASSWLVTWKPLDAHLMSIPEMVKREEFGQRVLAGMHPWEDAHCSVFPLLFKKSVFKLPNPDASVKTPAAPTPGTP
ncbi:MAG: fused MFS/spermidine synthase [Holophagaceae bacterium]|nr:fused MFS/spermidine synthase [Holophagaceae bacterium]